MLFITHHVNTTSRCTAQNTLPMHSSIHPLNTRLKIHFSTHPLSTHPLNTPFQCTLTTQSPNTILHSLLNPPSRICPIHPYETIKLALEADASHEFHRGHAKPGQVTDPPPLFTNINPHECVSLSPILNHHSLIFPH